MRKHRTAQANTIISQNIHTQIPAYLPAPDNHLNCDHDPAEITPPSYQHYDHGAAIEPWAIGHEDDEDLLHPHDHNCSGAQEPSLPLTQAEILTALTLTMRGQTMELLDFVREHFDGLREFSEAIMECAELVECELYGPAVHLDTELT